MKTKFEQIVDVKKIGQHRSIDINEIFKLASNEDIIKSKNDSIRRLVICIDVQKDFMECIKPMDFNVKDLKDPRNSYFKDGSLAVPGSASDVERITRFIYKNLEGITKIICSMDTHIPQQIFHSCWWKDENENHPKPYTIITYDDVVNGKWKPVIGNEKRSIRYLKKLQEAGKKQLCIWPYHCIIGTEGVSLENEFAKMVYFHSIARESKNYIVEKGRNPYSEMYGIIKPEVDFKNNINTRILNSIEYNYDEVYIVGEAASHCVLESVKQITEYFEKKEKARCKITVLTDCMSAIPGFEEITLREFENLQKKWKIKLANSEDINF